jgi:hypothetical protein
MAPALLAFLMSAEPGLAGPFDRSPRGYSVAVNRVLTQVESDLRFQLETCSRGFHVKCRFSSERVSALVEGSLIPPRIERIVLKADLLRNAPGSDPLSMVADTVLAFGATMMTFDPQLPPNWRVALLSDLMPQQVEHPEEHEHSTDRRDEGEQKESRPEGGSALT